jgi:15-cis-phytoene synthase
VDDIADDPQRSAEERRAGLEDCRAAVEALPAAPADDAVLVALSATTTRYPVPRGALLDLVDGGIMDAERSRYASWEELREYCRRVAGAVGLACTAVYGPSDQAAAGPRGEALGLALQQINIMRDVAEDWGLGRVYLPQDELAEFGVSEADIAAARVGSEWQALMEHQDRRAETLMREGLELLPLLDRRSALCVRAFAGIYRGLLVQMRGRRYDVFSQRPQLSAVAKVRAVAAL